MINVIGLGYIGLPTALMLASHGVEVIGTDYNKELVDTLNSGHTTFKEKGLDELFGNAVRSGIRFTTVDLPAPLGPTIAYILPPGTWKLTSVSTSWSGS